MDFSARLLQWYALHGRFLPWRQTTNPYFIWVSEIMLQQTRVGQGVVYFLRFIERFPDVAALAGAPQSDVLLLWQGLGYYTRARNLHLAAQEIMTTFAGKLPESYAGWKKLPGVGPYTASAIASIAFNQPVAAIDANVYRVIARLFGINKNIDNAEGKKTFESIANDLLDTQNPGAHNQAMMDFGALVCKPLNPVCHKCPFTADCKAFRMKRINEYPVKSKADIARIRFFNYFYISFTDPEGDEQFFVKKRSGRDIWENLFELPLIETDKDCSGHELFRLPQWKKWFCRVQGFVCDEVSENYRHKLTHQLILAKVYKIRIPPEKAGCLPEGFLKTSRSKMSRFPTHRLTEVLLEKILPNR